MPEPTGSRCDLPGVDVMDIGPEGITSVVGYIDQKTLIEQLGFHMMIVLKDEQPRVAGRLPPTPTKTWPVPCLPVPSGPAPLTRPAPNNSGTEPRSSIR